MHALVDACKKNGPTVSLFPLILPGSLASQVWFVGAEDWESYFRSAVLPLHHYSRIVFELHIVKYLDIGTLNTG